MSQVKHEFASEIDLDNLSCVGDVVHEVGSGDVAVGPETTEEQAADPLADSEDCKRRGNEAFKIRDYESAYRCYSDAVRRCPGGGAEYGDVLLRRQADHEEAGRARVRARNRREREARCRVPDAPVPTTATPPSVSDDVVAPFVLDDAPPHATVLAVYHSNRAATLYHLQRYDESIRDCTVAILLNPRYVKPLLRRMQAYEAVAAAATTDDGATNMEDALRDARTAQRLEPGNSTARRHVVRLEKLEQQRLDTLKTETMGKLKDLGNSILGNFGLSMDNFEAQQDPTTGSYNISFNQNK